MTSQHDCGHGMTFLCFFSLFLFGSTVAAIPLGYPPVDSMAYQHLSSIAESRQAIIPTSNIATLSPYLGRSHLIRDVSSWGTPSSTSAPPAQSNLDNQLGTTNEFSSGYQPTVAIALAATAGCIGVLLISLLTLFRLYKRAGLARPRAHALEVSSPVREWRVNIFRSNNMRIDPFTPVSDTTTTPFDSMGRTDFGPLPVIRISQHSHSSVDTESSFSSPTSPYLRDCKPRPPPLAVVPPSLSVPRPSGVQAVAGHSCESTLPNMSASLLSTSMLPTTPPPIYSETTPSNHITLTVPPVLANRRAK